MTFSGDLMKRLRTSSSSPQECIQRILQSIDSDDPFESLLSSKLILGHIQGNNLRLRKRRAYRNSFAPIFFGKIIRENEQTALYGYFRMSLFVLIILALFIGFLLYGLILSGQPLILCMLIPLSAIVGFGYTLGKSEEQHVTQFLQTIFENDGAK